MTRVRDWEQRFYAAMAAEQTKSFCYGRSDCATLMAVAVGACVPDHPALQSLGMYHSKRTALRLISRLGGLEVAIGAYFCPVHPLSAQTADIGLLRLASGELAGSVIDGARAVGRNADCGLFYVPSHMLVCAFRVE